MFGNKEKCKHPSGKLGPLAPRKKSGTWWFVADCRCGVRDIKVKKMSESDKRRHGKQ